MPSLFARVTLVALLVAPAALAKPTPRLRTASTRLPTPKVDPGRSIGSPTEGHLVGGAHLAESPYLRVVPDYQAGDARWGLEPLVTMIDRAARSIHKQYPDAMLSVGHLSRQGGGEIDRHASHESGRDADLGFYVKNAQGKAIYAEHFVAFKPDGTAASWPGAQFDDAKNWALVAAIAGDTQAHVTYIFVESHLRQRLLAYAEKIGAPAALRTRAAELMAQPRGSLPHDDHFHVRIACPAGSDKCVELPQKKKGLPSALASVHDKHPAARAKPAAAPPSHAAPHAAPHAKPAPKPDDEDKKEAFVPSLAPIVPGLDSVVIPAPLVGLPPTSLERPRAPLPPIDDPDGVLEP